MLMASAFTCDSVSNILIVFRWPCCTAMCKARVREYYHLSTDSSNMENTEMSLILKINKMINIMTSWHVIKSYSLYREIIKFYK